MENFRNLSLQKLLAGLAVLCFIAGFFILAAPQVSDASEPIALTVTGDGVEKTVQFTWADLEALPQATYTYSGYNRYPSLKIFEDMTGPTLKTILDVAGLKDNAQLIRVKESGGSYSDYTKKQLLDDPRYYFPDVENPGDVVGWPPERSEEGKILVETMLALNLANGKLLFGQRAPLEPIVCKSLTIDDVCGGGTIEVTTGPLEQWESPNVDIAPGTVVPGTEVKLQYEDGTNTRPIIYYTLDGTEPTNKSIIANISYPYFQPKLNAPVPINGNITIKAKAIGFGKLDSEVVTFEYNLGALACTIEGAGLSNPVSYAVETLKCMPPSEGSYQCSEQGQTVTLTGKGVLLGTLLDQLNVSSMWGVDFITAGGETIEAGTVQELKNQQCLLAYEVNDEEIADISGDETVNIQILRNLSNSDLTGNRLKYVNTIRLINIDDEITISSVKLLDHNGQEISSVAAGGGYSIEAGFDNKVNADKNALLVIQVRNGEGATAITGGSIVGCVAAQTDVGVSGGLAAAEFTMPGNISGKAYVDIFVWDNCSSLNPLGKDNHEISFVVE